MKDRHDAARKAKAAPSQARDLIHPPGGKDVVSKPKPKRAKPKKVKLKEIRIRPRIGEHDLQVKLRAATKFLEKGNQVRIVVMYRGRESAVSRSVAEEKLNRFLELGKPTSKPKWSGNRYSVVIA